MKDIFLLDMDDTLLDFERAERENFFLTLEEKGVHADEELFSRFHDINGELWQLLEQGGISREKLKVQRFSRLFEEKKIVADAEAVAEAYWHNFPDICFPFAGAKEFLMELSARGRVYIVTNGGAVIQRTHIRKAGFSPYVTDVFISEEVGADKPSRAFADHVKTHIDAFEESRAVWIGDSLTSDMVCAKEACVDFILFDPRGKCAAFGGRIARDFPEALAILGRL